MDSECYRAAAKRWGIVWSGYGLYSGYFELAAIRQGMKWGDCDWIGNIMGLFQLDREQY